MAVLLKQTIHHKEGDVSMSLQIKINVNSDGLFTTTLSESDVNIIKAYNVELKSNHSRRNSREGYFEDSTKNGLISQIHFILKQCFSRKEIDSKIILRYSFWSAGSFGLTKDGIVVPNLDWRLDGELDNEKYWQGGLRDSNSSNASPVGIQFYIKAFKRKVFQYGNGTKKIEYIPLTPFGSSEVPDGQYYLKWIEGICSISEPNRGITGEIDYTEQRAKFFVDLYKSIVKLSNSFRQFSEPENLCNLIENGKYLM